MEIHYQKQYQEREKGVGERGGGTLKNLSLHLHSYVYMRQ